MAAPAVAWLAHTACAHPHAGPRSEPGQTVTISFANQSTPTFAGHSETTVPEDVKLQIFQRSFSTKGPGRGLGTYSMKLLTERYLKGIAQALREQSRSAEFLELAGSEHATDLLEAHSDLAERVALWLDYRLSDRVAAR